MIAISEKRFYLEENFAEIMFCRNDRGEGVRMEGVGIGETLEAKKVP